MHWVVGALLGQNYYDSGDAGLVVELLRQVSIRGTMGMRISDALLMHGYVPMLAGVKKESRSPPHSTQLWCPDHMPKWRAISGC